LKGRSYELWKKFRSLLSPLDNNIDLIWLFQLPPDFKYNNENLQTTQTFIQGADLRNKAVIEFRNKSWWKRINDVEKMGVIFCSVDGPDLPNKLIAVNGGLYLRLHGSTNWYRSIYSEKELDNLLKKIKRLNANKSAIYLNNGHGDTQEWYLLT